MRGTTFSDRARGFVLVMGVAAAAPDRVTCEDPAPPVLRVYVLNEARVPATFVEAAQKEMTRIYASGGVTLLWSDDVMGQRLFTIKIVSHSLGFDRAAAHVMGAAIRQVRGTVVYVFYGRIEGFARAHEMPVSNLLAHVMAHEIGHLLLPAHAHAAAGLMREIWDKPQIRAAMRGQLAFTSDEARRIQGAAHERAQQAPAAGSATPRSP